MSEREVITSPTNPRVKQARKLQRRRERLEQGRVLLEGVRLVRDAWQARARLHHVFYAPELVAQNEGAAQLLDQLRVGHVELLACSEAVFTGLADTVSPQGVVAVAGLPELPLPGPATLVLLLDRVRDPGNAGTLLRSAEAAGADLVIFGPESVDPFNDKVLRAGMGAHFRQPLRTADTWEALITEVDRCLGQPAAWYVAEAGGVQDYDKVDWTAPALLAIGGEASGPSDPVRARARPVRIPMVGGTESLNAAVAGSVMLFEIARQRRTAQKISDAPGRR